MTKMIWKALICPARLFFTRDSGHLEYCFGLYYTKLYPINNFIHLQPHGFYNQIKVFFVFVYVGAGLS